VPVSSRTAPDVSTLADSCLGYLAEHPEELLAFMQHAGLDPQSLRASVGSVRLQHGLIDYFAVNEAAEPNRVTWLPTGSVATA
jgi:hypothetical protein